MGTPMVFSGSESASGSAAEALHWMNMAASGRVEMAPEEVRENEYDYDEYPPPPQLLRLTMKTYLGYAFSRGDGDRDKDRTYGRVRIG